ncbi:acyl-CoA desaturase [Merismopedia glauca]|uniref:Acyl-CoA desaturase n=1 Tax=Merismopedia glauca CCAP 1448/3 TaxID=1296344 RepID=A0A2T1C2U9_9CYAN|nr:acyl-CoA desaturase [Merismopedia glauca]PSB02443.1 acyl-CoA desaturase [Merismopedia glauca CCAP 1448/3]
MSIELANTQNPEPAVVSAKKSRTIANDYIKSLQINHFIWYNVLPFVGFLVAIASLWWLPIGSIEVGLVIAMWALTMTGVSVGFHRHFTHQSFKTSPAMRVLFVILGSMAAQGALISWVAVHRRHHEYSDEPGDPHSPNLHGEGFWGTIQGLWHSHVGWLINHEYPNPAAYAPELLRDKTLSKINRQYVTWIVLGLVIPAVIGGLLHGSLIGALQGFLWGGLVRLFLVDNIILSVNSLSHVYGTHPFETGDRSRNNPWIAIPTFGESWQNNHHAFATSACIGLKWWQIDFGAWVVRILEKLGLVWDVNVPSANMMSAKRVTS